RPVAAAADLNWGNYSGSTSCNFSASEPEMECVFRVSLESSSYALRNGFEIGSEGPERQRGSRRILPCLEGSDRMTDRWGIGAVLVSRPRHGFPRRILSFESFADERDVPLPYSDVIVG
ncbi:hypothetical protein NPIL_321701, partial [Nephila pilipes]